MIIQSCNPANGAVLKEFNGWNQAKLERHLDQVRQAQAHWAAIPLVHRLDKVRVLAEVLRKHAGSTANLITLEVGKLAAEARAEVEKSAWLCDYYTEHGEKFLADQAVQTDASVSFIHYQALGTTLAIMPWNFPVWQLMRCAVPALIAGNTCVLKHASNVPQCALHLEHLFREAGFPEFVFSSTLIDGALALQAIASDCIQSVSFTGSEAVGRKVAECAGRNLKKTVLELGGSDPFIVLEDADLSHTVAQAITSRFMNAGQSCIAAKRFIVMDTIADDFVSALSAQAAKLRIGDPSAADTTLAPMARADLRETLHQQIVDSQAMGAVVVVGGEVNQGAGWFYPATVLDHVRPGMPACDEELFGPAAAIIRVSTHEQAIAMANGTRYGLGSSLWTQNRELAQHIIPHLQAGMTFVNGLVKSDPRLPFGGIKASGYGRELSEIGLREFVNVKTVWQHW